MIELMIISELLLPEFDEEVGKTLKMVERLPAELVSWRPHRRSMTAGALVGHLAEISGWTTRCLESEFADLSAYSPWIAGSAAEAIQVLERNARAARRAIEAASDERWLGPWSLLLAGKTLFTKSRYLLHRSDVINHTAHHRAQLGVYFRMNEISVPGMYGSSADEIEEKKA